MSCRKGVLRTATFALAIVLFSVSCSTVHFSSRAIKEQPSSLALDAVRFVAMRYAKEEPDGCGALSKHALIHLSIYDNSAHQYTPLPKMELDDLSKELNATIVFDSAACSPWDKQVATGIFLVFMRTDYICFWVGEKPQCADETKDLYRLGCEMPVEGALAFTKNGWAISNDSLCANTFHF